MEAGHESNEDRLAGIAAGHEHNKSGDAKINIPITVFHVCHPPPNSDAAWPPVDGGPGPLILKMKGNDVPNLRNTGTKLGTVTKPLDYPRSAVKHGPSGHLKKENYGHESENAGTDPDMDEPNPGPYHTPQLHTNALDN